MKKIFILFITIVLILNFAAPATAEYRSCLKNEKEDECLSQCDYLAVENFYIESIEEYRSSLNHGDISVRNVEILYDFYERPLLCYIKYSNGTYIVVNNNKKNPIAVEYGGGTNLKIEKMRRHTDHIYYISYDMVFSKIDQRLTENDIYSIYDLDKNLVEENPELSEIINTRSDIIYQSILRGNGDYGVYNPSQLPQIPWHTNSVTALSGISFCTISEYDYVPYVYNHCGAVCAANLMLYYANRGFSSLKYNNSKDDTFFEIHNVVGNGPVTNFDNEIIAYSYNQGVSLQCSSVSSFNDMMVRSKGPE